MRYNQGSMGLRGSMWAAKRCKRIKTSCNRAAAASASPVIANAVRKTSPRCRSYNTPSASRLPACKLRTNSESEIAFIFSAPIGIQASLINYSIDHEMVQSRLCTKTKNRTGGPGACGDLISFSYSPCQTYYQIDYTSYCEKLRAVCNRQDFTLILFVLAHAHSHIGCIALRMHFSTLQSGLHRTSRLMDVSTIIELTISHQPAQLREITIQLLRLDIPQCQCFKAGSICYIPPALQGKQLAYYRGVLAFLGRL